MEEGRTAGKLIRNKTRRAKEGNQEGSAERGNQEIRRETEFTGGGRKEEVRTR